MKEQLVDNNVYANAEMPTCMTVGVVVPAYNVAPYIGQCLQSIISQDYRDLQIVVVDDGSTDRTPEVLAEYAKVDGRITVIRQENAGLSEARNTAMRHITAPMVTMVDGDDMLLPGIVTAWVEALQRYPQCDMAISGFTANPRITRYPVNTIIWQKLSGKKCLKNMLYRRKGYYMSAWGSLMRTALWKGVTFPPGKIYEDLATMWRIFLRCDTVLHATTPGYYYRQRPGSIINTFTPRRFDVLDICRNLVDEMSRVSPEMARAACDRQFSAACNILGLLQRNRLSSTPPADRCWEIIRRQRAAVFRDSDSRVRNRLAALLSPVTGRWLTARILARFVR